MTDKQRRAKLIQARANFVKTTKGYVQNPNGVHWRNGMTPLDEVIADLEVKPPPWANVGPVVRGQPSLLDYAPTHATEGIPLYVAFDAAWGTGTSVIAPEPCVVAVKDTSARPGEAVYLAGDSGLEYWVGHIDRDYSLGTRLRKGQLIGKTVFQSGGRSHGHFGVNVEAFLGKGKQLRYGRTGWGPNYTSGSPTIRAQLTKAAT